MIKLRMFITTDVYLKHMQNQLMRFMKSSAELVVKQDVHCQTETDNASPLPQNDIH